MKRLISLLALIVTFSCSLLAQSDLLDMINSQEEPTQNFTSATFKGSRLINGHTIITRKKGDLEFLIAHRFGRVNTGVYELFGLDNSNVRFGLEYGIDDQLTIGAGRNSFEKTYDGFVKYALFRQQTGKKNIPLSVTWFSSAAIKTLKDPVTNENPAFVNNLAFTHQVLIAQKVNQNFSWQLMPSVVHFNEVEAVDENDLFAVGFGARYKLTKRLSLNAEYYYRLNAPEENEFQNPIAIGVDIETGGHVFQLQFTNSRSMTEKGFIRETTGQFFNGDIHFGFNITRVF